MGDFFDSFARSFVTHVATFKENGQTFENGELGPETWTDVEDLAVPCFLWTGSQAESMVSEKLRKDLSAVAICRTRQVSAVTEDMRMVVNSRVYEIIGKDDVGGQGECTQFALKLAPDAPGTYVEPEEEPCVEPEEEPCVEPEEEPCVEPEEEP